MCTGKRAILHFNGQNKATTSNLDGNKGVNKQTEHLNIELVNGDIRLDLKSNPHIQILASHPPCYVDIQQNTVGQLYGEYTANLLYHFTDA